MPALLSFFIPYNNRLQAPVSNLKSLPAQPRAPVSNLKLLPAQPRAPVSNLKLLPAQPQALVSNLKLPPAQPRASVSNLKSPLATPRSPYFSKKIRRRVLARGLPTSRLSTYSPFLPRKLTIILFKGYFIFIS